MMRASSGDSWATVVLVLPTRYFGMSFREQVYVQN